MGYVGPQYWRLRTDRADLKRSAVELPPHGRLVQFNKDGESVWIDETTAIHAWDVDGFEVIASPGDVHLKMMKAKEPVEDQGSGATQTGREEDKGHNPSPIGQNQKPTARAK